MTVRPIRYFRDYHRVGMQPPSNAVGTRDANGALGSLILESFAMRGKAEGECRFAFILILLQHRSRLE